MLHSCLVALIACPALVGGPSTDPPRLRAADLSVLPGSPRLPRSLSGTALSPDGKRVAAYGPRRITVFDRRTGKRVRGMRSWGQSSRGTRVLWLDRDHLLVRALQGRQGLRSIDVRTGRSRLLARTGVRDLQPTGRRARVLVSTERRTSVLVVDGRARVRTRIALNVRRPTGGGVKDVFLNGRTVLAYTAGPGGSVVTQVGVLGGKLRRIALQGFPVPLTPTLLADQPNGRLLRIDPVKATVVKAVDTPDGLEARPFHGGAVVGLGRAVYDRTLERIADNPDAPASRIGPDPGPILHAGRLYARDVDCDRPNAERLLVVDPRTGTITDQRPGAWRIGVLGGPLSQAQPDDCD